MLGDDGGPILVCGLRLGGDDELADVKLLLLEVGDRALLDRDCDRLFERVWATIRRYAAGSRLVEYPMAAEHCFRALFRFNGQHVRLTASKECALMKMLFAITTVALLGTASLSPASASSIGAPGTQVRGSRAADIQLAQMKAVQDERRVVRTVKQKTKLQRGNAALTGMPTGPSPRETDPIGKVIPGDQSRPPGSQPGGRPGR